MRSLRKQLFFSHLALVALMALVMLGAIINFLRLGLSIDHILRDNYKSVIAAQNMKESLERIDSSTQFFLAGETQLARTQYKQNLPLFQSAYNVEANNITEVGEQQLADAIGGGFKTYSRDAESLLFGATLSAAQKRDYYFHRLAPQFLALKDQAQRVLDVNQAAILRADARARSQARQGMWIGILMTLTALGLALIFARTAINASLTPLGALAQGAEEIGAGHLNRRIELHRADEIGLLAQSFNGMAEKLREARRVEQQRLHRAQQMSDAALESLYDPVIVTDALGSVVHFNPAAERLFGSAKDATGKPIAQVVGEERIARAIEHAIKQKEVTAEEEETAFVPLRVGEEQRSYRVRATPMRDEDALLGAVLVLEDVTHLRELSRLKSEFIGVASHELRTPVTSLLLSAQLLEEGAAGALNPDQAEIVAAQREDLGRLDQLMRDLLDITRLESGTTPPRLEPTHPRELAQESFDMVQAVAKGKGVALKIVAPDDLPCVRADRAQMDRVLVNLLNNAIRHTPEGKAVQVEVARVDSSPESKVRFRVSDEGEGIPAEFLGRIFSRFVQVPGATRGGVGLGLSIAQTIVKAHGGEIKADSETGKGSTFWFDLPAEM